MSPQNEMFFSFGFGSRVRDVLPATQKFLPMQKVLRLPRKCSRTPAARKRAPAIPENQSAAPATKKYVREL